MIILATIVSGFAVLGAQMAVEAVKSEFRYWKVELAYKPARCRYRPHSKHTVLFKA